jgi:glycosyltransferase involved in cell wall biosynthesis
MKKILVATKVRGFLIELFNNANPSMKFIYDPNKFYETNSKKKLILSSLVKSRLADHLGVIQRINRENNSCDIGFSYNRFLKSDVDYVIYLENPLALVHYSTERPKTLMSKIKLQRYFKDPHLKSIICLSKACYDTVNNFYSIPSRIKVDQIYPFVKDNNLTNKNHIKKKCRKEEINCLYISSNFNLKGGKDILACFKMLQTQGVSNIKLKIITKKDLVDDEVKQYIKQNKNIEIFDFNFNKEKLNEIYNSSSIFLNPTRQDSFSLVVLEAIKSGNAIISTDLYAIPEMVENNQNGYLIQPKFRFFNYNNMPNETVWNNRKKTIYSDYVDKNIVEFLYEKLTFLNENREELERLCLNSYKKAITGEFSESYILEKWESMI